MTSKVPALIDYLVTTFTASAALASVQMGGVTGVTVLDGPQVTAAPAQLLLYVGLDDPDSEGAVSAASLTQSYNGLDASKRDEFTSVNCVAEAWAGTDDLHTVRVGAFAILAAVETVVRGNADQFGGNATVADPGVTGGELLQNTTDRGAVAWVRFQITFRSFT